MDEAQVKEGTIPLRVPSIDIPCSTYYKTFGDLRSGVPLVILHGGPGSGHEYLLPYAQLWTQYKIPLVFYDQIGCASSTHLPQKRWDKAFWSDDLFIAELDNLLDALELRNGFDLLGHSWGGMLSAVFASRRPQGLRRLMLASAPADVDLWYQCHPFFKSKLSSEERQAWDDTQQSGDFENTSAAFQAAELSHKRFFWCRKYPFPPEIMTIAKHDSEDPTVRWTMYGRSIFACNGTLQGWNCLAALPRINVPTLMYNGEHDLVQDSVAAPAFNLIPRVRWVTIPNASHMIHLESDELLHKVLVLVSDFLR